MTENTEEKLDHPLVVHKESDASYQENAGINIYNCADGTIDLALGIQNSDEDIDFGSVSVKKYDASGKCVSDSIMETSFDNYVYWLYDLSFVGNSKAELYDSKEVCIASIVITGAMDATYGDANGDGQVNAKDVVLIQRFLSGWSVEIAGNADANADGKTNAKDVVLLQRYLAGWNVTLGG